MVKLLWLLNGHKLRFSFVVCSLGGIAVSVLIFLAGHFSKGWPMPTLAEWNYALLGMGGALPTFLVLLWGSSWVIEHGRMKRLISRAPFNELHTIGFFTGVRNKDNKWASTDLVHLAEIDDFTIFCETNREKRHHLGMTIYLNPKEFTDAHLHKLTRRFAEHKIEFNNFVARKWYDTSRHSLTSIKEIHEDLLSFARLLKAEGYENRR